MSKVKKNNRKFTRTNRYIKAPQVRVILESGKQLGVLPIQEALKEAKKLNLDLVEISNNSNPPICKICDYGKFKYNESKQKKNSSSSTTVQRVKEVKFRVRTEDNDYRLKCSQIEKFIDSGAKVKVQLQFRGRENAHKELGFEVLNKVAEDVKGCSKLDYNPKLSGRAVSMLLIPLPEKQRKFSFWQGKKETVEATSSIATEQVAKETVEKDVATAENED